MRYPVLTRSKTESLARQLVRGEHAPNWELERQWVGSGQEIDLLPLGRVMITMRDEFEKRESKAAAASPEAFEGRFAGDVHLALRDLPIEALDDPGFWRYLSLVDFWWFVAIREADLNRMQSKAFAVQRRRSSRSIASGRIALQMAHLSSRISSTRTSLRCVRRRSRKPRKRLFRCPKNMQPNGCRTSTSRRSSQRLLRRCSSLSGLR